MKDLIFDFGRVLVAFEPMDLARPFTDEAHLQAVTDVAFDRAYWDKFDSGELEEKDVLPLFASRLPEPYAAQAREALSRWIGELRPLPGMKQLLLDAKAKGHRLYLLSNISKCFAGTYKDYPILYDILAPFDGLVFSGPLGLTKPGKPIFEHLLKTYGLKAENCIFVDDAPRNVAGCEKVGIEGYLFDGDAEKLRKYLGL